MDPCEAILRKMAQASVDDGEWFDVFWSDANGRGQAQFDLTISITEPEAAYLRRLLEGAGHPPSTDSA